MKKLSILKIKVLKCLLIVALISTSNTLMSQNLIPNAGFEHKNGCPTKASHLASLARGWMNPTKGTPDYYNICGDSQYKTPKNKYGNKKPFKGDSYVGLNNRGIFREYLKIRLSSPLKKGKNYIVKMHVSSSSEFDYTTSDIGFYFSKNYENQQNTSRLSGCVPQVQNSEERMIPSDRWVQVSGEFVAEGGETHVTIGSFRKTVTFEKLKESARDRKNSYIFIDNLSTVALERPKSNGKMKLLDSDNLGLDPYKLVDESITFDLNLIAQGSTTVLKSVYFDLNKYLITKESFTELNELYTQLIKNKSVNIKVIGHTDSSGNEEHNIELSEKRALSVSNYLIEKGISKERISYTGLGSSSPIKNSKQKVNRRVEFCVIK